MKCRSFEESLADACVARLSEGGLVSTNHVIQIGDKLSVGIKNSCDRPLPMNNLDKDYGHADIAEYLNSPRENLVLLLSTVVAQNML